MPKQMWEQRKKVFTHDCKVKRVDVWGLQNTRTKRGAATFLTRADDPGTPNWFLLWPHWVCIPPKMRVDEKTVRHVEVIPTFRNEHTTTDRHKPTFSIEFARA